MSQLRISSRALIASVIALVLALSLPVAASAIPRDVVLARGKVWVDLKVPYSQSRYATVPGVLVPASDPAPWSKGYRTDCSGFVSMCYDLRRLDGTPLSLDTASLPAVLDQIDKDLLQPGDAVLRPKNPAQGIGGHVVIFVRWVDDTRTRFVTYEEGSSKTGTYSRTVDYGTLHAAGYRAYRYKNIEDDFLDVLAPVSGSNRFATAAAASQSAFSTTAPAVVLASGENWPDALGGAALAGAVKGPILLTAVDALPAETARELRRLKPARVFVLGGTASVGDEVVDQVVNSGTAAGLSFEVTRIGGSDRYDTAALVSDRVVAEAKKGGVTVGQAYLASGENFPDALAVAPVASNLVRPILLTAPNALSPATGRAIKRMAPSKVWIVGGEASVDTTVAATLQAQVGVGRLAARDRYQTAVEIARHGESLGLSWEGAGLASGTDFPDALAGGAAQGARGSLLLLTSPLALSEPTATEVQRKAPAIGSLRVYGGMNTITYPVRRDVADILRMAP